jgi:hypothetical protein
VLPEDCAQDGFNSLNGIKEACQEEALLHPFITELRILLASRSKRKINASLEKRFENKEGKSA